MPLDDSPAKGEAYGGAPSYALPMPPLTAVVLAAGHGTRMRSKVPKMLHDLCGRPLALWPVHAAREAGARVVVVGGPDRALEPHLPEGVLLAVQAIADGTGGAARAASQHLDPEGTVLVINGDAPLVEAATLRALVEAHAAAGAAATLTTTELDEPGAYGRVVRDEGGAVARVAEAKGAGDATPEELAIREVNAGVYAFAAGPLLDALAALRPDNAQGELYLPDVVPALRAAGHAVASHRVADPTVLLGVNDRVELAAVRARAQARIVERHQRAGVTFTDPLGVVVDVDVQLGADTVVEPSTVLRGRTSTGEDCRLGPGATLLDARLGDGVTVLHAYLADCELHDGVLVGPFAYLRPGTLVREGAKVGTFVEMKNSDIGAGTKVPHLSYIGDADVGPGTNIGAGNVTANYDGQRKHRTRIGAGVKTSVDTTFVAPVEVGDGAWTAAGSVITQDVPGGALAVARARQRNVEDYGERRRQRESG